MTMCVAYGSTYRLNHLLSFFSNDVMLNDLRYQKLFCVKKLYQLKVKSFDFPLLATFSKNKSLNSRKNSIQLCICPELLLVMT